MAGDGLMSFGEKDALRERIAELDERVAALEAENAALKDEKTRLRVAAYKLMAELRAIELAEPNTVFCPDFCKELAEGAGLVVA